MRNQVATLVLLALLTIAGAAQSSNFVAPTAVPQKLVTIDGHSFLPKDVLIRGDETFVNVVSLADALNASVTTKGRVLELRTPLLHKTNDARVMVDSAKLSDKFRQHSARIPDEIERARWQVVNQRSPELSGRFQEIDAELNAAKSHVRTSADESVYFALSHANTSLAIMYYKLSRGVAEDEARSDELDLFLCGLYSKVAVVVGKIVLSDGCSVLERAVSDGEPQPAQK